MSNKLIQYSEDFHADRLKEALLLAQNRRGFCAPNPAVGAVLVNNEKVIASGQHWAAGFAHAEVDALKDVTENLQDAILYVTLEPCCHSGKTPPCTQRIIEVGVRCVYYAYQDPNPAVSGKGAAVLRQAGIQCQQIEMPEIEAFYASYTRWVQQGLPTVTAKIALSLDGKIAGVDGASVAITGGELKKYTHEWRRQSDAILTTANTVIQDDPQLTVRLKKEVIKKPLYVLDTQLRCPLAAKIMKTGERATFFHAANADEKKRKQLTAAGACCVEVGHDQTGLDLSHVLNVIGGEGIHDVWVEAGGCCFQALWTQRLMNRAFIYTAPVVLGPKATPAFSEVLDMTEGAKRIRWCQQGDDAVCEVLF